MTWVELLAQSAWRGSIVLAAAFAAAAGLRRASAAVRHFVWTAALAAIVVLRGGPVRGAEVELAGGEGGAGAGGGGEPACGTD